MRIMPKLTGRLPGAVIAMLGIGPGERVVAWGSGPGADATQTLFAAATDKALYLQATGDRLPWDRISKATWNEPVLELVVLDGQRPAPAAAPAVEDARDLPAAVHDRVTASVVISERVDLRQRRGCADGGARAVTTTTRSGGRSSSTAASTPPIRPCARRPTMPLARLRDALGI